MFGKPGKGERKHLEADGTRALAEVVEISKKGWSIEKNGNVAGAEVSLKTTLKVQPPDGMPAFEVHEAIRYSQFDVPSVGDRLHVIYDPDDHEQIMLDPNPPAAASPFPSAVFPQGQSTSFTVNGVPADASDPQLAQLLSVIGQKLASGEGVSVDPLDRLAKLGALKQQGLLTDAEFEEQKQKILRAD